MGGAGVRPSRHHVCPGSLGVLPTIRFFKKVKSEVQTDHFVPKLKNIHLTVTSNHFNHHPHNTVSQENLVFLSHLKSEHFGMQPGRNCELMHSGKAMYTQVAPGVTAAVTVTLSKLFT